MFSTYQSNQELVKAVKDWQEGHTDDILVRGEPVQGTMSSGSVAGVPVFQFATVDGTKVAESTNCVSFIPAGFRKCAMPNTMNPVREEIGGLSTRMSLVHVLTIPKNKRIYNAASLVEGDTPLVQEMTELGRMAVKTLLDGDESMTGSLRWELSRSGSVTMDDGSTKDLTVVESDLSPSSQEGFMKVRDGTINEDELFSSVKDSFHVYPAASIGWLHTHTYVGDLLTTAHDSMESEANAKGYRKNTPVDEVIKFLSPLEDDDCALSRQSTRMR